LSITIYQLLIGIIMKIQLKSVSSTSPVQVSSTSATQPPEWAKKLKMQVPMLRGGHVDGTSFVKRTTGDLVGFTATELVSIGAISTKYKLTLDVTPETMVFSVDTRD
jgi:hypothetical protein